LKSRSSGDGVVYVESVFQRGAGKMPEKGVLEQLGQKHWFSEVLVRRKHILSSVHTNGTP
jgi:hypothetical protein